MPGPTKVICKLELDVKDDGIHWKLSEVRSGGDVEMLSGREPCDGLLKEGPLKETIRLLVTLQRWLGDALAEHKMAEQQLKLLYNDLSHLPEILGQNLYTAIFPEGLDRRLSECLGDLKKNSQGLLRIQLQFDNAHEDELSSWPWEYLFIPNDKAHASGGHFLASIAQLLLSRKLSPRDAASPSLLTNGRVKVLLVCSAPLHIGPVLFEPVLTSLRNNSALELIELVDDPPLTSPLDRTPNVSWERFKQMVTEEQPHVVHFIGHGKLDNRQGKVAFVDRDGKPDFKPGFAEAAGLSRQLKLVFLQACDSALPDAHAPMSDIARRCARSNIPAVVAMQAKIGNDVAGQFACRFYETLAQGHPVDYAVMQARHKIMEALREKDQAWTFGVPVLYLRSFDSLMPPPEAGGAGGRGPAELRRSGSEERRVCPRCRTLILREQQRFCTNVDCRLPFFCDHENKQGKPCNNRLEFGEFEDSGIAPETRWGREATTCGECGQPVNIKPPPRPVSVESPVTKPTEPPRAPVADVSPADAPVKRLSELLAGGLT